MKTGIEAMKIRKIEKWWFVFWSSEGKSADIKEENTGR